MLRLLNLSVRCALVAAVALALGGCGRKGSLDPPPGGLAEPTVIGAPPPAAPGPDGQVAAAPTAPQPPAKKTTPLDWLLN